MGKKSKKKSKKKDKDSDEDEDGKENKESKKKKKKGKKKKDKDPESNDEDNQEEDIKPLVPYGENEDVKTTEESSENQEEKQPADPTKFINSFSEAKADETKPKLNLPTLVFNDKTVELAPKENTGSEVARKGARTRRKCGVQMGPGRCTDYRIPKEGK